MIQPDAAFRLLLVQTEPNSIASFGAGFVTQTCAADLASVHPLLTEFQPHAVVARADDQVAALFRVVRANAGTMSPLCIALADTPLVDFPADAVLPADPIWCAALLRDLLMTRERQRLLDTRDYDAFDVVKTALVRNISHELRTPLLHIKSAVAMLAEDADRGETLVNYAMQATARLEAAVKNIMQLAEILDLDVQPATLGDSVAQALREVRRTWVHRDHAERISIQLPPDLPLVLVDKQAISIVLQLLIDNALKFSRGQIEVHATTEARGVRVSVRDHGIGIPPEKLDLIFTPFFQIDQRDARRFNGMGIGLAIVRLILIRHRTSIAVKSVVDEGSDFSFILPRFEPEPVERTPI